MVASEAPSTHQKAPWGLVILLGAMTAFAPMSIDMYLPAFPAMAHSLGASPEAIQGTLATFFAGMAVGQFIYGPASDRFGRRGPILIGVAVYIVASIACALAPTVEALTGARLLQALGGCAGAVVARAVVRDHFDHHNTARVLSLLVLVMGLAPILAPIFGGWILVFAGWRAIFWVLALFGAAVGLAVFFRLKESRSEETAAHARSETSVRAYAGLIGQRRFLGYLLGGCLNSAVLFAYISSSPVLIMETYGFSPQAFTWIFAFNAVGVIGASQLNRYLLRRATPDQVLRRMSLAALFMGVLLTAAAFTGAGGKWTVLPLLFVALSSYGLMAGNTTAGALSVDPRRAGSASALIGGASFGMGAMAASLTGLLHDGTAKPMAGVMLVCLLGSTAALFTLAFPRRGG